MLVNNAGYGSYGTVEDVPPEEARRQCLRCRATHSTWVADMRAQGSGTIVNVSSMGGKMYEPFGAWCHATKFALEGLSDCLRLEVAPFGIRVVVIEPGGIKIEWGGIAVDSLVKRSGSTAYGRYATQWSAVLKAGDATGSEPSLIADAIVRAVAARRLKTRYVAGAFARPILALRWLLPDRVFDGVITALGRRYSRASEA